jgi:hypothetical protein
MTPDNRYFHEELPNKAIESVRSAHRTCTKLRFFRATHRRRWAARQCFGMPISTTGNGEVGVCNSHHLSKTDIEFS